jgi:hypothetical protein
VVLEAVLKLVLPLLKDATADMRLCVLLDWQSGHSGALLACEKLTIFSNSFPQLLH